MKTSDKILWSAKPPRDKEELWGCIQGDNITLKRFHNGQWRTIGGSSSSGSSGGNNGVFFIETDNNEEPPRILATASDLAEAESAGKLFVLLVGGRAYYLSNRSVDSGYMVFINQQLGDTDGLLILQYTLEEGDNGEYTIVDGNYATIYSGDGPEELI